MPQLDISWFPSQLFWLAVCFSILFIGLSVWILPPLADIFAERKRRLEEDLHTAESFKKESEALLASYQAALAAAEASASEAMQKGKEDVLALLAAKEAESQKKLQSMLHEHTEELAKTKTRSMEEIRLMAADVADEIVARLLGKNPPRAKVEAAVEEIVKQRREA